MSKRIFEVKDPDNKLNPVDWFNFFGKWETIFEDVKGCYVLNPLEASSGENVKKVAFELVGRVIHVLADNTLDLSTGSLLTPFMLLTAARFKGQFITAQNFVMYELMEKSIDYIRVTTDYIKVTTSTSRFGATQRELILWKKEEIKPTIR